MKKIYLALLVFLPFLVSAQTDSTKIVRHSIAEEEYCMIIATGKIFSNKVSIEVDYGQKTTFFGAADARSIKDEEGKLKSFNSVIDALNFMAKQGWVFVDAYPLSEGGQGKVLNYIMRRKPHPIANKL